MDNHTPARRSSLNTLSLVRAPKCSPGSKIAGCNHKIESYNQNPERRSILDRKDLKKGKETNRISRKKKNRIEGRMTRSLPAMSLSDKKAGG
jgi:hypothetical protein